ncbi:MAG TPA: hypothetical protein VGP55_10920 [Chitinophagaceae bacterium]|nr:hypothetical protein [Chitinophagaceae bacterium]
MKNFIHRLILPVFIFSLTFVSCTKMNQSPLNSKELVSSSKVIPYVPQCNSGYHWDFYWKKCIADCPTGYHNDSITGACVVNGGNPPIIVSYAGVNISYYTTSHTLSFNSTSDVNTVLNQLDADYENYNTTYENQYPNYTALQLDSLDSINNFDQLQSYRNFEAKFSGYTSKRSTIETIETTWLNNNFVGADPDSLDFAFDHSENAICNSNYQLQISNDTYQMTDNGLVLVGGGNASPLTSSPCFTNRRKWSPRIIAANRAFQVKAAIHFTLIRSSAKGKVVSYKLSGNKWKRSRYDLAVGVAGTIYASDCSTTVTLNLINPGSGYKKRRELKEVYRTWGISSAYYTQSGLLGASFVTPISQGSVILQ